MPYRPLTPEEDAVGDPDDEDEDDIDPTLPADLWYCFGRRDWHWPAAR